MGVRLCFVPWVVGGKGVSTGLGEVGGVLMGEMSADPGRMGDPGVSAGRGSSAGTRVGAVGIGWVMMGGARIARTGVAAGGVCCIGARY